MGTMLGAGFPSSGMLLITAVVFLLVVITVLFVIVTKWGAYWLQAYMSDADVSMKSLIVMTFLKIEHRLIVTAKIMVRQAGLRTDRQGGISTNHLQVHQLAGGDVMKVVSAIIVAHRAGIDLDFDRAAAIDLAGRDPLLAVQTSVSPKVIYCPPQDGDGRTFLKVVAKDGVELLVGARVTVRTNLDQLIGGATEETIAARVGQAIVSAIGSAETHMDVLEMPSQISKGAMAHGLDANTAFSIVSIDISDIDVGENIGARLQRDQASADMRIAQAVAEVRRAEAIARIQQMKAKVAECRSKLVLADAEVPAALAVAFRAGQLQADPVQRSRRGADRTSSPKSADSTLGKHPDIAGGDKSKSASPFPRASKSRGRDDDR